MNARLTGKLLKAIRAINPEKTKRDHLLAKGVCEWVAQATPRVTFRGVRVRLRSAV